jgi:uncharacterized protein YcbX
VARIARLTRYPIKALSPQDVDAVRIADSGALDGDRAWALYGPDGDLVNGKRTARVHAIESRLDGTTLTVAPTAAGRERFGLDLDRRQFDLGADRAAAEDWLSAALDLDAELRRESGGKPDRAGTVSVISTATLEAVADWFDGATVDGMRRRLRANVEVGEVPASEASGGSSERRSDGVDPFWEDRFAADGAPDFAVGDDDSSVDADGPVRFEGVEHCGRCVVPTRDPDTGEATPDFRERFVRQRRAHYPEWVDADAVPHDFTLMLIARVSEADRGRSVAVGDSIRVTE